MMQDTSLNVRGNGDSQNLKGQEILRSLNFTNEKKLSIFIKYVGGGDRLVYTNTILPKYIDRENLIKPLIDVYCHM